MKLTETKLTEAETWEGEHLSEVALSCLADAQDVVDPIARVHAESCAECMFRVGTMALESHEVGAALRVAKASAVRTESGLHRFPTMLVAAAIVVAAVCGTPALIEAAPSAVAWVVALPRLVPIFTTSVLALSKSLTSGTTGAAVSVVSTLAFALIGYLVARASRTSGALS